MRTYAAVVYVLVLADARVAKVPTRVPARFQLVQLPGIDVVDRAVARPVFVADVHVTRRHTEQNNRGGPRQMVHLDRGRFAQPTMNDFQRPLTDRTVSTLPSAKQLLCSVRTIGYIDDECETNASLNLYPIIIHSSLVQCYDIVLIDYDVSRQRVSRYVVDNSINTVNHRQLLLSVIF